MVTSNVETEGPCVVALLEGDGHICTGCAAGLDIYVSNAFIRANLVLIEGLAVCQVTNGQLGIRGPCSVPSESESKIFGGLLPEVQGLVARWSPCSLLMA